MNASRLTIVIFYLTVFCTGAAVLIFEVAAVRLFAPYFGSSLYVLSSVLTVILTALSLGYFFGGRLADRFPTFLPLYLILLCAGIFMLALLHVANYLLPLAQDIFTIKTGPLIMAAGLFFIPAFLLGIDSPYIIKLLSEDVDKKQSGAIVGSTFFWSTVGSIVGSIAAGFVLIPHFGLTATIASTAVFLVVASATTLCLLTALHHDVDQPIPWTPLLTVLGGGVCLSIYLFLLSLNPLPQQPAKEILYQTDGFYSNIMVYEQAIGTTTYRFLQRDTNSSSAILPGSQDTVFAYAQVILDYPTLKADAASALVLGGGAYTIPRQLFYANDTIQIDTIEIEPKLLSIARKYFELPQDPRLTPYEGDARLFLADTKRTYDIIVSDVMNSGYYIPPHLTTIEFFTHLKSALAPDGIAYINSISALNTGERSLMGSLTKTIAAVFPNYEMVALVGPNYSGIQNIVYVVRHDNQPITFGQQPITNIFTNNTTPLVQLVVDKNQIDLAINDIFTDNQSTVEQLIAKQFLNE